MEYTLHGLTNHIHPWCNLIKNDILIWQLQGARCLYISILEMLNSYTIAELFPPLLSACIVAVHQHWGN